MSVVPFPQRKLNWQRKYIDCLTHLAEELEKAGMAEAAMFVTAAAGSIAETLQSADSPSERSATPAPSPSPR